MPTLWLYLSERFDAQPYFLGIVMSAFSFMGLFSGPIMGRMSDKTGKTKYLILFANLWEIGGNVMYWMGFNKWFILGSRLIAGVGTGVGASIIAQVSLATTPEERTGVLSILMLCRQVGLLFGPAFNLFLRYCDFKIGSFVVDAYTVPGLFMAMLWGLHEIMVICLYFELKELQEQEQINTHIKYSNSDTTIANLGSDYSSLSTIAGQSATPSQSVTTTGENSDSSRSNLTISGAHLQNRDRNLPPPFLDSPTRQQIGSDYMQQGDVSSGAIQTIDCKVGREVFQQTDPPVLKVVGDGFEDSDSGHPDYLSRSASKTNDMIETAERYMTVNTTGDANRANGLIQNTDSPLSRPHSHSHTAISTYSVETIKPLGRCSQYINEYMREEIVVILFAVFASLFNQTGLEALVTPLTQRFLNWKELENSMMYLIAGAEVCLVFLIVRWLSKCLTDCTLILGGFIVEVVAVSWLLWFMPNAQPNSQSNLAPFIVGVFLDCFGLPFIFTCSISLYSKVTSKETQGFSHGLRRSVTGLATIAGPLWCGSLVNNLFLCLGGTLGCMVVALLLTVLSFRHMRRLELRNQEEEAEARAEAEEKKRDNSERQPLLL
ncbi:uncharacterized protein LOC135496678 isoform X2 [Lineus longissimus]